MAPKHWNGPFLAVLAIMLAAAGYYTWTRLNARALPEGLASGNGRIEAVEIDIAAKMPGRIKEILADEGALVTAGQILARMDTAQLEAQQRQAEAQLTRARIAVETAGSLVAQREAERNAAQAVIAQRDAQLDAAQKKLARSEQLKLSNNVSEQVLDDDLAAARGAKAALSAAQAQLAASEAAIGAARAAVVDARAAVEAAKAAVQTIGVDLEDSVLRAPRDGRVQYRVAQPGEVLASGGRVLNMVDLTDVSMTFFLPTSEAGRVAIGTDVRLVLDAAPAYVIPATVTFVSDVAQFTPKSVETEEERLKLMFRLKARIPPDLLRKHINQVKTGLPGVAYVRLDPKVPWPTSLPGKLAQ